MKFGAIVWLSRGSLTRTKGKGRGRDVLVKYISARGHQVYCRLLQDDPDACDGLTKAGDRGWWERSSIRPLSREEQQLLSDVTKRARRSKCVVTFSSGSFRVK